MRIFTKSGLQIAHDFERIIHGGRGDYIEISLDQIIELSIIVPEKQVWRLDNEKVYYWEFRSKDISDIMLYFQMRLVKYADYKIGFFYVDPYDVVLKE